MSYAPLMFGHEASRIGDRDGCWCWDVGPWRFEIRRTTLPAAAGGNEVFECEARCQLREVYLQQNLETEEEALENLEGFIEIAFVSLKNFAGSAVS